MEGSNWDVVIVGTGAAGLVAGHVAGGLGLKVACIEADRVGGECSWTGCVPSKALLHAAAECWRTMQGDRAGIRYEPPPIDTSGVLEHVRQLREEMAAGLNRDALLQRGIQLIHGRGRLVRGSAVVVGERELAAKHIVIATGSRASVPPIEGLEGAGYLINAELFELPAPPESMVIVGAGPIGVEMAQAFGRLGTEVTVVEQEDEILPRDDPQHAERLREVLSAEGVEFVLGAEVTSVERVEGERRVFARKDGVEVVSAGEELLIATGRAANTEDLGLEELGIAVSADGIAVNRYMRTSHPRVWAVGDVNGAWQFSHIAEYEATIAMRNALIGVPQKATYKDAGWCTFTDPELARCGMLQGEAEQRGIRHAVYRWGFDDDDRARVDGEAVGEVKVVADPGTGRLYGAQILGPRAGEVMQEFLVALRHGIPIQKLSQTVHLYPTLCMTGQRAGQMWFQQALQTGLRSRLLSTYLRWRGFKRQE